MLGRKNYSRTAIDVARAQVEAGLAAYRSLPVAARTAEFEALFFNREVHILDYLFVHRLMVVEGKDGNALNEVRVLCNSLLLNDGEVQFEKLPGWPMSAGSGIKL